MTVNIGSLPPPTYMLIAMVLRSGIRDTDRQVVGGTKEKVLSEEADRFLDSFRLLDR